MLHNAGMVVYISTKTPYHAGSLEMMAKVAGAFALHSMESDFEGTYCGFHTNLALTLGKSYGVCKVHQE